MNQSTGIALFWFGVLAFVIAISVGLGHCQQKAWHVIDDRPKQHFWQKHPTRTKVLTAIGLGSLGVVIALATRHDCAKTYDGKPYSGTPPCPK